MKKKHIKMKKYLRRRISKIARSFLRWRYLEEKRAHEITTPFHNGFTVLGEKLIYAFISILMCAGMVSTFAFMFIACA